MERLTYRENNKVLFYDREHADWLHCTEMTAFDVSEVLGRLAEYEDADEQGWIYRSHALWLDVGSLSCRCSLCGCKNNKETKFCPNCGSKMDLEQILKEGVE